MGVPQGADNFVEAAKIRAAINNSYSGRVRFGLGGDERNFAVVALREAGAIFGFANWAEHGGWAAGS